jgi:uncharacterized protein
LLGSPGFKDQDGSSNQETVLMTRSRWIMMVPAAALLALGGTRAEASGVRDSAGLFSRAVVKKVDAELDQIERRSSVPIVIETVESLSGVGRDASAKAIRQAVEAAAESRAGEIGYEGVYLLISKNDHVFSEVLVKEHLVSRLPRSKRLEIRDALVEEFKAGRFDEGLIRTAQILDSALSGPVRAGQPRGAAGLPVQHRGNPRGGGFGIGTLLMIGLGIFGVLLVFRILGGLFGRSGSGYSGPMNAGGMSGPGMGPGYGPGYGYGSRGGGFFSGMLGGLGGALAGNWLYDQFSGRHSGHTDASSYAPGETPASYDPSGEGFVGGTDDGGGGTSWDDPGGDGGGDWGGGDGGGDWGGGGGDWGGGGGDGGGW